MILSFGIPKLDELFGRYSATGEPGICAEAGESVSVCLVGADGTGKSVLALHLASQYAARYRAPFR